MNYLPASYHLHDEKLVKGIVDHLDREKLISTILKFRRCRGESSN